MENVNRAKSSTLGVTITIVIGIVLLAGLFVYWDKEKSQPNFPDEVSYFDKKYNTIEERISDRRDYIECCLEHDLYYELPEKTIEMILSKLGVNADINDIAKEYKANRAFYISHQAIDNIILKIDGPDADKVDQIEVRTIIKPEEEKIPVTIKPTVADSIVD